MCVLCSWLSGVWNGRGDKRYIPWVNKEESNGDIAEHYAAPVCVYGWVVVEEGSRGKEGSYHESSKKRKEVTGTRLNNYASVWVRLKGRWVGVGGRRVAYLA